MKTNTKIIIIVLIIAAVAAYLVWKRKKDQSGDETLTASLGDIIAQSGSSEKPTGTVSGAFADHTSLDYILEHITFTTKERNKIEAMRQAAANNAQKRQQIQAKANVNGYSFDQQLVLEAIWALYNPTNTGWIAGPDGTTTYGWRLQQKVIKL